MSNVKMTVEGFPILGWQVSWSTHGFSISRDELVKALEDVGIDARVAKEVLPKNAAIRATRTLAKGANKFHRKVADGDAQAAFVIASTEVSEDFDASFSTDTKVVFNKSSKDLTVKGQKKKEVEEAFEKNKVTYAGDQFRAIVLRYIKRQCNAVTWLETGNVYFILTQYEAEFKKIRDLFDLLKSRGVKLCYKEEVSTKQIRSVAWDVTVGEITAQARRMKEELEELSGKSDDVKESSIATRLKRYSDLRNKLECYETALQGKSVDVRAELEALTASAKKLLT